MTLDDAPARLEPWQPGEIDVLVAAYLDLLASEIRGQRRVKADVVRDLASVLSVRTPGSIERKMQNVSAVLDELGLEWIEGYKPMSHYQKSLRGAVQDALRRNHRIQETLEDYRTNALPPLINRPLSTSDVLVPTPSAAQPRGRRTEIPLTAGPIGALRDFQNRRLGTAGEEWVLDRERIELTRAGRQDLADRVNWIASEGDGAGFDIQSFRPDGSVLEIEVKTTNLGSRTPFYVTRWEVAVSRRDRDRYALYRVFDFRSDPRLYRLTGSIEDSARLEPTVFAGLPI
jgi:hypothetical protein